MHQWVVAGRHSVCLPLRYVTRRSSCGASSRCRTSTTAAGHFQRTLRQLSIGLSIGSAISIATFSAAGIGLEQGTALLAAVAVVISIVAAFAALGPTRRSLRLPTVEVLRVDG